MYLPYIICLGVNLRLFGKYRLYFAKPIYILVKRYFFPSNSDLNASDNTLVVRLAELILKPLLFVDCKLYNSTPKGENLIFAACSCLKPRFRKKIIDMMN